MIAALCEWSVEDLNCKRTYLNVHVAEWVNVAVTYRTLRCLRPEKSVLVTTVRLFPFRSLQNKQDNNWLENRKQTVDRSQYQDCNMLWNTKNVWRCPLELMDIFHNSCHFIEQITNRLVKKIIDRIINNENIIVSAVLTVPVCAHFLSLVLSTALSNHQKIF